MTVPRVLSVDEVNSESITKELKKSREVIFVDDPVNHPSHYIQGGIETIEVIEAWRLSYCLGNTVKYISRAGKKDVSKTIEDLEKARWYLDREIAKLKAQKVVSMEENA